MNQPTQTPSTGIIGRFSQTYHKHREIQKGARSALERAKDPINWNTFSGEEDEKNARRSAAKLYPIRATIRDILAGDPDNIAKKLLTFLRDKEALESEGSTRHCTFTRTRDGIYIDITWPYLAEVLGFRVTYTHEGENNGMIIHNEQLLWRVFRENFTSKEWGVQTSDAKGNRREREFVS